jgi:AraC-like DNA-binding protein
MIGKELILGFGNSPSPEEIRLGLWANSAGHFISRHHILKSRVRRDLLLIYCVKGCGLYRQGERDFEISAGQCFFVPPDLPHEYYSDPEQGWDIWFTHFDGELAARLTEQCGFSLASLVLDLGVQKAYVNLFRELCGVLQAGGSGSGLNASAVIFQILLELIKHPKRQTPVETRIFQALSSGETNITGLARRAGMSRFHFIRECRRVTGETPGRHLILQRVRRARELLLQTDFSVKQIAFQLGFSDQNYFSRVFTKETGVSASEYRRKQLRLDG